MAEPWALTVSCLTEVDVQRTRWLIKTLQHDPNVKHVEVLESISDATGSILRLDVTFIEGHDCPHGATLHTLDHTHGEKADTISPRRTWLERVLRGFTPGV